MQKTKLNEFIKKYSLGGKVNSVSWKSNGTSLSTKFVTPCKSLLGEVMVDDLNLEKCSIGVFETDKLSRLLGVLDGDDISTNIVGDANLVAKCGHDKVSYPLADLSIIPEAPELKTLPDFQTKIKVDSKFISSFIRGKGALPDDDTFTIMNRDGSLKAIIGYSNTNTANHEITLDTETDNVVGKITFNAELFKEVLSANNKCKSAVLEVSNDGLARISFKIDDYDSTYYIVAMQDVD